MQSFYLAGECWANAKSRVMTGAGVFGDCCDFEKNPAVVRDLTQP